MQVLQDNTITLVPTMGAFMVQGSKGSKYAVTLFPKENCQCPTGECYHIIAAKMSIGYNTTQEKKTINLTQLRKRSKKCADKKSGRKRPRLNDIDFDDFAPAPDSRLMDESYISDISHFSDFKGITPIKETLKTSTPQVYTCNSASNNKRSTLKRNNKYSSTLNSALKTCNRRLDMNSNTGKPMSTPSKSVRFEDCINRGFNNTNIREIDSEIVINYWIKDLHLTEEDKETILNSQGWLHSQHMEAVNILARQQAPNINGLQLPEIVPVFNDKENRWITKSSLDHVNKLPICQIHHNGKQHWVSTFQTDSDSIYVFDSLKSGNCITDLSPSLQIQIAQIYGNNKSEIKLFIPNIQQQTNGSDCGLFAIAHIVEFLHTGKINPNILFNATKFRDHLCKCLENKRLEPFPKSFKRNVKKKEVKPIIIPLFRCCHLPEVVADMVACDNCGEWYHKHCVANERSNSTDGNFLCSNC